MPDTVLLRPKEVADKLGCSVSYVYMLVGKGVLRSVEFAGQTRIEADEFARYIESLRNAEGEG